MSRRKRRFLIAAGALAGLILLGGITAWFVLQSGWFYEKVRAKLVQTVETATGGRVEIGSFRFHWRELRAEVRDFVLHGDEPAGKPPLVRASLLSVGLKIISLSRRDVDVEYADLTDPRVYLIVYPDGRTNVPEPKVKKTGGRNAVETILDLAVGRFSVRNGIFEVESRGQTPFAAEGRNLQAKFAYRAAGPRYQGDLSIDPLDIHWKDLAPAPLRVNLSLGVERNRVQVSSGRIATGASEVAFRGWLENLSDPRVSIQYNLKADVADAGRVLRLKSQQSGTILVAGNAAYSGGRNLSVTGNVHVSRGEYRDSSLRLNNVNADAALEATWNRARLGGLRATTAYQDSSGTVPVSAQVHSVELEGRNLAARGIALAALGGSFRGTAGLTDFERYRVQGELAGFAIRTVAARYSGEPLPWDGLVSGTGTLEGSLKTRDALQGAADLVISPAAVGAPVRGRLAVKYDKRRNLLDLGRSFIALPNSRLDLAGAVGQRLTVHFETRDLNDILPAVGAKNLPVKIESGAAVFDGAVTGKAGDPRIAGRLTVGRLSYERASFDSLQSAVAASRSGVAVENLQLARGPLRAQGHASVALSDWKLEESSAIAADFTVRDAAVSDLLAMSNQDGIEATGTLNTAISAGGTYADPQVNAELTITQGSFAGEPFDRLAAKMSYSGRQVQVASAQLDAGPRQVNLQAAYMHAPGTLAGGRLQFEFSTNQMGLDQFRTLEKARPGIQGAVQLTAKGGLEVLPARPGQDRFRILDLHADLRGRGMQLIGQPLGDARLTADSEGGVLRAHLASDFANSRIRGDGEWKLAGDYPGSAKVTLTRLDFQQLRQWISPRTSARQFDLAGSAEGELQIEGPARKPELLKAELRIPKFEASPVGGGPLGESRTAFSIHNQGPIVATLANKVVTVDSARLVGRSTDLSLSGKILLQQKNPLDLRVNGRVDLTIMQDLSRDIFSSGQIVTDATVRGAFQSPQINGRMELKDASFSVADLPNGISRANGVVVFSGDRATIQNLAGETGGGKVELSGFAGFGGEEMVFRINATAEEVRVRYPEGVSTVADADLVLSGTTGRSMLSGTITILRTGFNLQSDISSVLAKSAEPVRTPSAGTGFTGGLNFDIQIETSPDVTFQSSLAEGLQLESNLRLRGTASNPALLGRVNLTQGQIVFFGTKYNINQGSIAFYNPVKIEPVLNIDLETKARGVDVTLTVSGPLNKLSLTPRSDPPLQFSEIVALLATGRSPTSDPSLLAQQAVAPQSWQQMGASALLGQAIANPVAGRIQRFFGVSKLKIDPSLTGVENNPQARLTLEQQVTQNITFTYITNVTNSNPQIVRVEWAFSRQWSAVAVREENGLFGLDFFYKRRFK